MVAITRELSDAIRNCELTHLEREPIDVPRARTQHRAYEEALERLGCRVVRLDPEPDLPDAVFVEDTAIVVDELAIITRPGAQSRRAETASVARVLGQYRELRSIDAPDTIDGGDVVVCGRRVFIGRSSRTNDAGIERVRDILSPFGYTVTAVDIRGCLHLKSAATVVSMDRLLVNPAWVSRDQLRAVECLAIAESEAFAANVLRVGAGWIYAASFPRTRDILERHGISPMVVEVDELAKAEGAVTCCSLLVAE
jgi:dimethylargininase